MSPRVVQWIFLALLIAVLLPTTIASTLAEQECTTTSGDVVKTDDPYSSDQDGCVCTTSGGSTCYCLVGYGTADTSTTCDRSCTDGVGTPTDCLITGTNDNCASDSASCECGVSKIRDATKASSASDACIDIPVPHCDPSADDGVDRTCACAAQTSAPNLSAYMDPELCFCIGGYTTNPTDKRFCTQDCPDTDTNCQISLTDSTDCTSSDTACRCAPGYAPRINTGGTAVECIKVFCIHGEGNSVQASYCKQDSSASDPLDPYNTMCATGTGPKAGTSYCSTDCAVGVANCMNSDQTRSCEAGDEGCQCAQGRGLVADADKETLTCDQVYCTKEESNCMCETEISPIDECWCSYGTTADPDIPGWCTSACKPGNDDNCVRGDTGERCYSDYVGSAGCHCRMQDGKFYAPTSGGQATASYSVSAVQCTTGADCYDTGPNDNCDCTNDREGETCTCADDYMPDPNNPGLCIDLACSVLGQYRGDSSVYSCNAHSCNKGAAADAAPKCFQTTVLDALSLPLASPYVSPATNCHAGGGDSSSCTCDYGYYPDASGACVALAAGYCDQRFADCDQCPTGVNSLTQCTCKLGYYVDERDDNGRECLRFCTPGQDNCVVTGGTTVCPSSNSFGTCVCAEKYRPQKSGNDYVCVEIACDFLLESNCEEGTYVSSTNYNNVHCAEGFVPDPVSGNKGECTGGCSDTDDNSNCMQGGSVTSPGSSKCSTPPCFCRLGYNPVYDSANSKIICTATECNPLVATGDQCKCQYTAGSASFDMTSCKCADKYAPAQPNDGTCTNVCGSGQANCKVSASSIDECTGNGCVCRPGYTSVYNTGSAVYQCEPYECDASVTGCVCSNPGDVTSCTCSGTTTLGSATIRYVGNKYAFPGYCRPLECDPSSDSNCACVDSTLLDTCYCKPGYAIDYKWAEINTDATTNSLNVNNYFTTTCKQINYRSSCPLAGETAVTPSPETGCACSWSDKVDNQYLCFCGLVIDEDCFVSSCKDVVDNFAIESDGPCSMDTETVDSVTFSYSMCRDGLLSDMAGACTVECDWTMNSPNTCKESDETCNTGYVGHLDLFGNRNCYVVECEKGSTNCNCEAAITKLHNWDNRLCRCAPGYAPDGSGGCTDQCAVGSSHCNRTCDSAATCCAFGYTPRTTWTADSSSRGYTATVNCVSAACNTAVDSAGCKCSTDAYDEGLDKNQCACESGKVHSGKGDCVAPDVASCISCSGTGVTSGCYETEIQTSQIDTTAKTVTAGSGNVFSLETCNLDSDYNQNYKSCEVRYVTIDGGAPVVTRGCSSQTCSTNATLTCTTSSNVETCYKCCSTANCNIFSAKRSYSVALDNVAIKGYFIVCILFILY